MNRVIIDPNVKIPKDMQRFLEFVKLYAKKHNKTIKIVDRDFVVESGGRCCGYCDGDEAVIAGKHKLFKQTLVHEFSHLTQNVDKIPLWDDPKWYFDWIDDQNPRKWDTFEAYEAFLTTMELERDCEMRAMRFIKRFDINIDLKKYAQRANLYLRYYQLVFLERRWLGSDTIYVPSLVNLMPTKILPLQQLRKIDMNLMKTMKEKLSLTL